jgi:hypothetical protein
MLSSHLRLLSWGAQFHGVERDNKEVNKLMILEKNMVYEENEIMGLRMTE